MRSRGWSEGWLINVCGHRFFLYLKLKFMNILLGRTESELVVCFVSSSRNFPVFFCFLFVFSLIVKKCTISGAVIFELNSKK